MLMLLNKAPSLKMQDILIGTSPRLGPIHSFSGLLPSVMVMFLLTFIIVAPY